MFYIDKDMSVTWYLVDTVLIATLEHICVWILIQRQTNDHLKNIARFYFSRLSFSDESMLSPQTELSLSRLFLM